ncbi:MAG: glycosyltransferase family A protein [Candidimonas sp.]
MHTGHPLFTVMTPTFNRAHTLRRVYDSLRAQTCGDFEWLVVDDGSTDDTRGLIESLRAQADFPVRYVWQLNQHKKAAFNHGVREAAGELIVALDSDDTLEPSALAGMAAVWHGIDARDRHRYVAVTGLCVRPGGRVVGDRFPRDVMDATPLDMWFRYRVRGEKFGCLSSDVLRRFPFPQDVPGFVPESLVWRAMGRAGYLTRFVNQVFRVYHDSADALSHQGREGGRHALGLWMLAQDTVVHCLPWFRYAPLEFFKAAARYTRFSLHMRRNGQARPADRSLKGSGARLLVAAMWPAGLALYLRDRFGSRAAG